MFHFITLSTYIIWKIALLITQNLSKSFDCQFYGPIEQKQILISILWATYQIYLLTQYCGPKNKIQVLANIISSCHLPLFIFSFIFSFSSLVCFVNFVKSFLRQLHLFCTFLIPHVIAHSSCIQSQFLLRIITFVGQFTWSRTQRSSLFRCLQVILDCS